MKPATGKKKALLLSPETYEEIRQALENQLVPDTEDFIAEKKGKKNLLRLRRRGVNATGGMEQTLSLYDLTPSADLLALKVKITPGFVINITPNLDSNPVITRRDVSELRTIPAPEYTVEAEDIIGITVETNKKDIIIPTPVIAIKKAPEGGTQAIPDPVNVDGSYFYPLAKFNYPKTEEGDPDTTKALIIEDLIHCGGPIHHHFKINEIINRASLVSGLTAVAYNLYDKWSRAMAHHLVRKLWQFTHSRGYPTIIGIPTGDGLDYEILHVRVAERETLPQIRVNTAEDGKIVVVEGNGADGTLVWEKCDGTTTTLLDWKDGLITTVGEQRIIAGCTGSGHEAMP